LSLSKLAELLLNRWRFLAALCGALSAVLIASVLVMPFPYLASAIVFVDPREIRVTLQEEVLSPIGTDAAVLESVVQIVKSDGFLIKLMEKLGSVEGLAQWNGSVPQVKALAELRKKIEIERMGATYLVKLSYRGRDAEQAAKVANEIAAAFAKDQNDLRSNATLEASRALTDRLVDIRRKLDASEEAVFRYKAESNIVYLDESNTVKMRQLSDLSQQMAAIKAAAEEAEARYAEYQVTGNSNSSSTQPREENEQLAYLHRQRAQLQQMVNQQSQIYGPRHPLFVQTKTMIEGVDRQIDQQRKVLGNQLKAERDIHLAKERQLAREVEALAKEISRLENTQVKLAALQREADADRDLYQQLLSRKKATNELAQQPSNNVRVVSPALPPLSSTRPSLILILPVVLFFSLLFAIAVLVMMNLRSLRKTSDEAGSSTRLNPLPDFNSSASLQPPLRSGSLLDLLPDVKPLMDSKCFSAGTRRRG